MNAWDIYKGSDGEATKRLYAKLETKGPQGIVAVNLFRAQKCSSRAKVYRGRGFKQDAYDRKNWSLKNLCDVLTKQCLTLDWQWGWKEDDAQTFHRWVLYIDLPTGQASFHAESPLCERRYAGEWDGQRTSAERIIRFVQSLLDP